MSVVLAIIGISFLILIHELGHLLAARRAGVRVHEFGIGFPPCAFILGRRKGTIYSVNWIPFGGFVRLAGEGGNDTDTEGRFDQTSRGRQAGILAAGPFMNIIAGLVFTFLGLLAGTLAPIGTTNTHVQGTAGTYVVDVLKGSPAEIELRPGTRIIGITNRSLSLRDPQPQDITNVIQITPENEPISLTTRFRNTEETVVLTPTILETGQRGIGVGLDTLAVVRPTVWQAIGNTFSALPVQLWNIIHGLGQFFGGIFSGAVWEQVAGPVGIVKFAATSSAIGVGTFFLFLAFLSYNLAVLNLLPIPALDGGRLVIVAIEAIRRRKLPERAIAIVNTVTFFLLIALMVAVTAQDIFRLF